MRDDPIDIEAEDDEGHEANAVAATQEPAPQPRRQTDMEIALETERIRQERYAVPQQQRPWYSITLSHDAIVIRCECLAARRHRREAKQAHAARWREECAKAREAAVATSEPHRKWQRLSDALDAVQARLDVIGEEEKQAKADVLAALADGNDPSQHERRCRELGAEGEALQARVDPLNRSLSQARRDAEMFESGVYDEVRQRFREEREAREDALHAELLPALEAWLERALDGPEVHEVQAQGYFR